MLVFIAFIGLITGTIASKTGRQALRQKSCDEWILDGIGLILQGLVIPVLQGWAIAPLCHRLLPQYDQALAVSPVAGFVLSFVVVDYLYYWNHRGLHSRQGWRYHQTHHTVTTMDVLGTARNTVWTSFFILYLWIHGLALYLLDNPTGYLLGVSVTAALDLWRHSQFGPQGWLYRCLCPWLITPQDHAWHHSVEAHHFNYGANFNLWDRWHGTYQSGPKSIEYLGVKINQSLTKQLFLP